ncbi:spartin [Pelomyxa schiedti]|nr:spartin [Pelomyxa schiedti]
MQPVAQQQLLEEDYELVARVSRAECFSGISVEGAPPTCHVVGCGCFSLFFPKKLEVPCLHRIIALTCEVEDTDGYSLHGCTCITFPEPNPASNSVLSIATFYTVLLGPETSPELIEGTKELLQFFCTVKISEFGVQEESESTKDPVLSLASPPDTLPGDQKETPTLVTAQLASPNATLTENGDSNSNTYKVLHTAGKAIDFSSTVAAEGIAVGGSLISSGIMSGEHIVSKFLTPKEVEPSQTLQLLVSAAKVVSPVMSTVASGLTYVVDSAGSALSSAVVQPAIKLGSEYITHGDNPSSAMKGAKECGIASLKGFAQLWNSLELAGTTVFLGTSEAITDGVTHKYGTQSGELVSDGLAAVGSTTMSAYNISKLVSAKRLVQKLGTRTAVHTLNSYSGDNPEPTNTPSGSAIMTCSTSSAQEEPPDSVPNELLFSSQLVPTDPLRGAAHDQHLAAVQRKRHGVEEPHHELTHPRGRRHSKRHRRDFAKPIIPAGSHGAPASSASASLFPRNIVSSSSSSSSSSPCALWGCLWARCSPWAHCRAHDECGDEEVVGVPCVVCPWEGQAGCPAAQKHEAHEGHEAADPRQQPQKPTPLVPCSHNNAWS